MTQQQVIDTVFQLYEKYGQEDYIGEPVSQLEHMSQAAQLALQEGYDDEVVLAAFFHDIGHICALDNKAEQMGAYGVARHEKIGADFLRSYGFPERVALLVENHVQAKRYLSFKHAKYYDQLSEASKQTLQYQGGRMTAEEAMQFEQQPLFEISIKMRTWDELAKELTIPILDLELLKKKAALVLTKAALNSILSNE